jgi:hypothetical protein
MAKRAPKDERPFNPIESALVERVASRSPVYEPRNVLPETPDESAALPVQAAGPPVIKRPPREKRVLLSWEEELALQRLLDQLTETLQTPVKLSNALRSCLILLRHAQGPIVDCAAREGALVRPANNDQTGIALFEHRLASIFQAAFASAGKPE